MTGVNGKAEEFASLAQGEALDFTQFERALAQAFGNSLGFVNRLSSALEPFARGRLDHKVDPRLVPFSALRTMGTHPMVYLAERSITGMLRRTELYSISHPDPRVVAETDGWLRPLLPVLLGAAARAFAYGSVPVVFDWGMQTLRVEVDLPGANDPTVTFPSHTHYTRAYEIAPVEVSLDLEPNGELRAVGTISGVFPANRAHVFVWDGEFGEWAGQGARRRAWRDYVKSIVVDVLQARYLERSVDSPRKAFAPVGKSKGKGETAEEENVKRIGRLVTALIGSGVIALPDDRDDLGNRRWDVETLDLPDRSSVWTSALNRYDGRILLAYLVSPSLAGLEDMSASAGRVLEGMLSEFIQDLVEWVAENLTKIVEIVHCVNHDPRLVPAPVVKGGDVPAAVRKTLLEVLKLAVQVRGGTALAALDVDRILDTIGAPTRPPSVEPTPSPGGAPAPSEAPPGPPARPPGRPRDATSAREARREGARTPEGEEATGAPAEGVPA